MHIKFWTFWKQRWPSILMYLRNYRLQKTRLVKCWKSPISEHPSIVNMLKGLKHCRNLQNNTYHTSPSPWEKLSWKMFVLLIPEVLGLFANTLTTNEKCSLRHREKLLQPIQMQLPIRQKIFCHSFATFLESTSNFEDFE